MLASEYMRPLANTKYSHSLLGFSSRRGWCPPTRPTAALAGPPPNALGNRPEPALIRKAQGWSRMRAATVGSRAVTLRKFAAGPLRFAAVRTARDSALGNRKSRGRPDSFGAC